MQQVDCIITDIVGTKKVQMIIQLWSPFAKKTLDITSVITIFYPDVLPLNSIPTRCNSYHSCFKNLCYHWNNACTT